MSVGLTRAHGRQLSYGHEMAAWQPNGLDLMRFRFCITPPTPHRLLNARRDARLDNMPAHPLKTAGLCKSPPSSQGPGYPDRRSSVLTAGYHTITKRTIVKGKGRSTCSGLHPDPTQIKLSCSRVPERLIRWRCILQIWFQVALFRTSSRAQGVSGPGSIEERSSQIIPSSG